MGLNEATRGEASRKVNRHKLDVGSAEESDGVIGPRSRRTKGRRSRRSRWRKGRRPRGTRLRKPRTGCKAGDSRRLDLAGCVKESQCSL